MAVPNLWRTKRERYSLQGQVCPECSNAVFPPRLVCPRCHQSLVIEPGIKVTLPFAITMAIPTIKSAEVVVAGDD